jgi:DNA topoisomerase-1
MQKRKPLKIGRHMRCQGLRVGLGQKRTKKGKTFYSCSNYPPCTFSIWDRPINRPCPQCQDPFLIEKIRKKTGSKIL